jgi:ribose-phosphate pyrophosphokinase
MEAPGGPLLFALSESGALGAQISHESGIALAALEERAFEDGEFKLRPLVSVRGRWVILAQTLAPGAQTPTAQRLVRLLFLIFGMRGAGAARVSAVVPYLAYARKDRRTQPRDPVTMSYVAQLMEAAGLDHLIALDVHNPAALDNAFRIFVDHLSALPMFAAHFARTLQAHGAELAVASPDVGGIKRAQLFREALVRETGREIDLLFIEKRRAGGVVSGGTIVGQARGRHVIVIDDLCASGGTLIRAADVLHEAGCAAVHAAFTHAPSGDGIDAILADGRIASATTTDSTGLSRPRAEHSKLTILPVGPLFGSAIARMVQGAPVSELLLAPPPAPRQ